MINPRTAGHTATLTKVFYGTVLTIAAAGSSMAAQEWLGWILPAAIAAIVAVELGAVALSIHADERRQLGEAALPARILSAAVALGAVALNWFGHADKMQAAFFAGMSALGYCVWLINAGARRRDALRADNLLPPVAPVYGLVRWVTSPIATHQARALALRDPELGLYGSIAAVRDGARRAARLKAIAHLLKAKIERTIGKDEAAIAVHTYDMDRIAAGLADAADYDGLVKLLGANLTPAAISGEPVLPVLESTADEVAPISSSAPVDLVTVSKTMAVHYAHTAVGNAVPAATIVAWLDQRGVTVSESLVRKARKQVADQHAALPRWASDTAEQQLITPDTDARPASNYPADAVAVAS
jgi:hypothetical protein